MRQFNKPVQHKENGEGCAILVKRGHIGFLDRFCLGFRQGDSVRFDGLAVTPSGMPFLQIDRVCSYMDEDTIMQIDAVTLDVVRDVVGIGVSHCLCSPARCQWHCAQKDSGQQW